MPGYFDDRDKNENKTYKKTVVYFVAAVSLVMLLFLAIIYANTKQKQDKRRELDKELAENKEELDLNAFDDETVSSSGLKSEDLDFWDMYEKDEEPEEEEELKPDTKKDKDDIKDTSSSLSEDKIMPDEEEKDAEDDGKHIKAKAKGQDEKWYEIIEGLEGNDYDLKGSLSLNGLRPEYSDRNYTLRWGVDVSKYQGAIDWAKVKAGGVDYAMIRVGARGYGSGQLMLDENFVTNIMGARGAGLDTGVYFFSQAVTEEEAIEEANFTAGALLNYGVTYPVALDVEWVENDQARTDDLSAADRTKLALKFCETIKAFGYTPVIYATKDMLIAGLNPDELKEYDVWLCDEPDNEAGTDYPYRFSMWQYTRNGHVDGITGDVDLNLYFIRSKEK
ncbi:MAG: glycoside hydrolase family 25 protein [Lachnospiraceae bacterium]|nr:glycoside hydrolase family 25 protein [Lachnospiraceae bacterium]